MSGFGPHLLRHNEKWGAFRETPLPLELFCLHPAQRVFPWDRIFIRTLRAVSHHGKIGGPCRLPRIDVPTSPEMADGLTDSFAVTRITLRYLRFLPKKLLGKMAVELLLDLYPNGRQVFFPRLMFLEGLIFPGESIFRGLGGMSRTNSFGTGDFMRAWYLVLI